MKGRKPKPAKIKELSGNPGKRKVNTDEPKIQPADLSEPPDYLDEVGVAEWERLAASLPAGLITDADVQVLGTYCASFARAVRAMKTMAEDRCEYGTTASGYLMPHPANGILNQALGYMMKAAVELGFTPSARSRVVLVANTDDAEAKKTAKIIEGGRATG